MNLLECLRVALRGLSSNKMRTGLTMLGIIIGVGVVILVVAIGEGATQRVTDAVNSLGTNLLTIRSGAARIRVNAVTLAATAASSTATTGTAAGGAPATNAAAATLGPSNHLTFDD